jgi:putative ABC transport system permease protein
MIRPRWRKVLRDLWSNKTRTVLVVLSISVGIFAVGTIASTRVLLSNDLSADYTKINPSSAIMFTAPFDDDLVHSIRQIDGVREAEGRFNLVVPVMTGPDEWRNLRLEAIVDYHDVRLDRVRPESGPWPPPTRALLIERASLGLTNANVDDALVIKLPDGRKRELRVAGLAHDLNKVPAAFSGTPYGYITFDTLDWLGYPRAFNALHVLVDGNASDKPHVQSVIEQVRNKIEGSGRTVRWMWVPEPGTFAADEILQPMIIVLGALAFLSLFLSSFLVINTTSALLMQQVRQIGMMKSIGASNGQIMRLYFGMVLIFGLLSLFIAIPIAALVSYEITRYLASLINFNFVNSRIPLQVLALEIAVGLLVPLAAALHPITAGVRITVRSALNHYGIGGGQFGHSPVDRLLQHTSFTAVVAQHFPTQITATAHPGDAHARWRYLHRRLQRSCVAGHHPRRVHDALELRHQRGV